MDGIAFRAVCARKGSSFNVPIWDPHFAICMDERLMAKRAAGGTRRKIEDLRLKIQKNQNTSTQHAAPTQHQTPLSGSLEENPIR